MSRPASGGVFLSYRREETAPYARLLDYQVRERFPRVRVFMDVDAIEPGRNFVEAIEDALDSSAVLLAVVGRQWLTSIDEEGQRRLDDPDDYVRRELQTALERGVLVIPVLVDNARPPRPQQLPAPLVEFARLQAVELSHRNFQADVDRILNVIERALRAVLEGVGEPSSAGDRAPGEPAPLSGRPGSPEPAPDRVAIPQVLLDRYEVGRLLGAGGLAEVYEGHDRLLARRVAIKALRAEYIGDQRFLLRFRRETQAAASLSHPNIVGVYDLGSEGGTQFVIMEYVDGRTLKDIIRAEGRLDPQRAAEICEDVCSALAAAHTRGLIHRDIKPANVMLTSAGHVKVMDLTIARTINSERITQTGTAAEMAQYISPEAAQGQQIDVRSDLYSLGCCLYEMLTGTVPFTGATPVAIAYKHVHEDPTPPRQLNPDVPPPLEAICLKAMAKLPDHRYQTAAELRADLDRFRNGKQGLARRSPPFRES
jgi:tRNA A-37 threonylcarbamoyl transferase component Bud32